jgi:hypothetical protein
MPDMPYMERVGRQFVSDISEVLEGIRRIEDLKAWVKPANKAKAESYLRLYIEQNPNPKTMKEWRVLRDGMIKRLMGN